MSCCQSTKNRHEEPIRSCHIAELRRWGPVGRRPTRVVGRPPSGTNRPQLFGIVLSWASSCPNTEAWPVLSSFAFFFGLALVYLSLNLRSDFIYDFVVGQSVLATYKLA